jgi:ferric-dicitrate binding protein FerR (iron transport regulator)
MDNIEKYSDREWEDLASILSDEQNDNKEILSRFMSEESHNTTKYWKEIREMNSDKDIDIDKAWNNLYSRLKENGLITGKPVVIRRTFLKSTYFRVAAMFLLLLGIGSMLVMLNLSHKSIVVSTNDNQKNLQVTLPDGSNVFLNRNTKLSYHKNFANHGRNVRLSGEAFFEITRDERNPFIVDAGKAKIQVLGTSFNVITNNSDSAVEVFVQTGKVMVSDIAGKSLNNDPNYMSWKTGLLFYDGQSLEVVFRDLKKVYNMDIVADDPAILVNRWTTDPIDNLPQETIIRLICISFNLSFSKDGNIYHLAEK